MLYSSLIPPSGSRIALPQDKQLEIAHVEIYWYYTPQRVSRVQYTQCGRFGCVPSEARICEIRRPKITFVNVLFPLRFDPPTLPGYLSRLQIYKKVSILCAFLRKIFIIRCKFQDKALFLQKISIESWGLCWSIWRYGKKGKQRIREKEPGFPD